jgi:Flp pilus assembly pilin Flp
MVLKTIKQFCRDDSGAITVDFVMLTAVIVSFGFGVIIIVTPGIRDVSESIEPVIQSADGLAHRLIGADD